MISVTGYALWNSSLLVPVVTFAAMTVAVREFVRQQFQERDVTVTDTPSTNPMGTPKHEVQPLFVWLAVDSAELVRRNLLRLLQFLHKAGISPPEFWDSQFDPNVVVSMGRCS